MRSLSLLGASALVFALAVFGMVPSVYWLDGGNLAASAWGMGVAHPPGEPAWLPVARLAQLVPVGDIAFRVNLLSACSIAGCAVPLLWACGEEERGPPPAVVLLVLAVLLGFGARLQAVRAEVYGPTALILTTALAAALRLKGCRASAAIGVLLGLGAGVHPLLCVAAAPALLLARGLRSPVGLRDLGWFLGAGAWSFAAYAWLPLRALADPSRAWGLPSTPDRFLDVLLARNFSRNFGADGGEGTLGNLLVVSELWQRAGVPMLVLLALLACVRWRGNEPSRGSVALLAVVAVWILGNLATVLPQNKVFATNPDLFGYLLVGVLGAVPLAARGVARIGRLGTAVAACFLLLQLVDGATAGRSDDWNARRFAVAQSYGLPPGAILVTSGNDTAFAWTYLQRVERRSADLLLLHRVLLGHPHELARLGGVDALASVGVPWDPGLQEDPMSRLGAAQRPVFVELRDVEQPRLARGELRRHGMVAAAWAQKEGSALRSVRSATLSALAQPRHSFDLEGRLVLAYYLDLWGDSE